METTVQWRHVITDCVCLVTEMAPFFFSLPVCSSGWPSWCDVVFLFQLLHSGLAAVPRLSFQLSRSLHISLALSLALFPFLSFSLTDTGHCSPPWPSGPSPPRKVCPCVFVCTRTPACVNEGLSFSSRGHICVRLCLCVWVCVFVCVCVSVEGSSFARWTAAT